MVRIGIILNTYSRIRIFDIIVYKFTAIFYVLVA